MLFEKVSGLLGLPIRSHLVSQGTSRGFDPPDNPVIFVSDNLLCTLLFTWKHAIPDHDHRSLIVAQEIGEPLSS